jgi:hypothetical protein
MSRVLIVCALAVIASLTGCADGSAGTSSADDAPARTVPGSPDDEEVKDPTQDALSGTESSPPDPDTTASESDEPSADVIREAVEYLYATNPLSFVEGDCFGYGAEADFGAVVDVTVTGRDSPESRTLGLATGPLTGTRYPLTIRVSFSNGLVGDYPTMLFRADSADGGGWYVNVNMCGWYQFA